MKEAFVIPQCIQQHVPDVEAIWVYGSVAKGSAGKKSDIDIAVLAPLPINFQVRLDTIVALNRQLGREVDLVDMRSVATVLRKEIVVHGKRIFCIDALRCDMYEDFIYADYARLNEERALILKDIFERKSIYG